MFSSLCVVFLYSYLSFFSSSFFFLMIRRPPRSTLFPYTTALPIFFRIAGFHVRGNNTPLGYGKWREIPRSEEHTSELQSLTNLVCRLLLEKKKKQIIFTLNRENEHREDVSVQKSNLLGMDMRVMDS